MPREKQRLVACQPSIVPLQSVGDRVEARVGRKFLRERERVQPFRDLRGRRSRVLGANTEAVERDHASHARRTYARIVKHHIAAETVPREIDLLVPLSSFRDTLSTEMGYVVANEIDSVEFPQPRN